MRKTVNISIGSSLFVIEESAYARLDEYLQGIRSHFAATPDAEEIVSDIENRIAEEFAEKISSRKKVVSASDVEEVMKRMGTVEDFRKFEEGDGAAQADSPGHFYKKIRIYRDADDQVIAGVCAGIAKYFGIDPLFLRLAFGLSIFLGGFGVVLYILLWIILPQARTTTEKVEMTGGKLTLSAIEQKVKQAFPARKRRGALRKLFLLPFQVLGMILRFIGRLLGFIVPLIGRIVGAGVMLGAGIGIAAVTFVFLALLLNPASPYIGFPLREAVGALPYLLMMLSGYFLVFVPLILLLQVGISFVLFRSLFSLASVMSLVGLWLIALVTLGVTGFSVAPGVQSAVEKYHSEHFAMHEQVLGLRGFNQVSLTDHVAAEVTQGAAFSVIVESAKSNTDTITATVEGGVLRVARTKKEQEGFCLIFCPRSSTMVKITMPALTSMQTSNHSSVSVEGFNGSPLRLSATDHSFLEADLTVAALTVEAKNHSALELRGSGTTLTVDLQDHANLDAEGFRTKTVEVRMDSHTFASVDAEESIAGMVDDHSVLEYTGSPRVTATTGDQSGIEGHEEERW